MGENNKRRIGIMGGTFDPPHLGHLLSAEYVAEELLLEKVIFMPTGNFTYKDNKSTSPAKDRLYMTKLAVEGNGKFEVCDIENSSAENSYTCFSLEKLHKIYTNSHFYFIVGADSLDYMDKWKNPERIFELASVVAVSRKGFTDEMSRDKACFLKEKFGADICYVSIPNVDISSSEIRLRVKSKKSIRYMVSEKVLNYIEDKGLYL